MWQPFNYSLIVLKGSVDSHNNYTVACFGYFHCVLSPVYLYRVSLVTTNSIILYAIRKLKHCKILDPGISVVVI